MNRALHPEIVVTETPEGVHYCLPKRDSPLMQMGARALLAMAIVVWSVPFINAWFMGGPGGVRGNFVAAISVVTLVPIALFSGALLIASLFFLGHSEVTLTSDDLVVRERARLFGISRRRRASQVRRLTVRIPYPVKQTSATGESMFANDGPATLSCIEIDMADGKRICAGIGYSTPLLVSLAEELRSRLQTLSSKFEAPLALAPVEVLEGNAYSFHERIEQPAKSTAILERQRDGVTITIPPLGMRRACAELWYFSLLWNGFMVLFTVGFVASLAAGNAQGDVWEVGCIVLPLFWLVGIGLLLAAIHRGRRHAMLAVVGDSLMTMQAGLFGTKQGEWRRDGLVDIRPGPSGMEVNDEPVLELHIVPREGRPFGLLRGRDVAELEWMATVLRRALRIPDNTNAPISAEQQL